MKFSPLATPELIYQARPQIKKKLYEKSYYHFFLGAWRYIDPAEFIDNWHIQVICEHLERLARREVRNLVVCIPPRHCKSLLISVAFPAWIWTWNPSAKFICASYDEALVTRDSVNCRRLIESDWYREYWGETTKLVTDQNQKQYYQTTAGGHRLATTVRGRIMGHGGDYILCDDPHNTRKAEREVERTEAVNWWKEAVPTRVNDPKTGCKMVIQQRVHEEDLAGYCLKQGYHSLILPAEFEHDHPNRSPYDPRTEDGELLWKDRFDRRSIEGLKTELGNYASAGQLQQRPTAREGGVFKRHWFGTVRAVPANRQIVRAWDLAATEKKTNKQDPDWTVGLKMSMDDMGTFYVENVVRLRESSASVERAIKNTCTTDVAQHGQGMKFRFPQDPGQAGKAQAEYLSKQLAGFTTTFEAETGDKGSRADPVASQAEMGNIKLVEGDWNETFLNEVCSFPNGAHDDQVDAMSGAFRLLLLGKGTGMLDFLRQNFDIETDARLMSKAKDIKIEEAREIVRKQRESATLEVA